MSSRDQDSTINVYQKSTGSILDLYAAGALIVAGVLCLNLNRIFALFIWGSSAISLPQIRGKQ